MQPAAWGRSRSSSRHAGAHGSSPARARRTPTSCEGSAPRRSSTTRPATSFEQVRALAPDGVTAIIDNYHDAAGLVRYAALVRPGGTVASPVAMGGDQALAGLPVTFRLVQAAVDRAAELGEMAARGELSVPIQTLPLERADEALARQATRTTRGKLVLTVGS